MHSPRAHYLDWASTLESRSRRAARVLAQKLAAHEPSAIFDFGFGDGVFLSELALSLPRAELAGADVSRRSVQEARSRIPGARLEQGDAAKILDASRRKFDLIVASHVLYYFNVSAWADLLRKLEAKLYFGGCLAVCLVAKRSTAYAEPLWNEMQKRQIRLGTHDRDGAMAFAEELQLSLKCGPGQKGWDIGWKMALPPARMSAFLDFLYRIDEGDPACPHASQLFPEELSMIDRWVLVRKEG
ncbi:MAG TPA: class I SAM-dependent methyltransferase [Allosphingosinicella sp.]